MYKSVNPESSLSGRNNFKKTGEGDFTRWLMKILLVEYNNNGIVNIRQLTNKRINTTRNEAFYIRGVPLPKKKDGDI